jgi:hypothetical protein
MRSMNALQCVPIIIHVQGGTLTSRCPEHGPGDHLFRSSFRAPTYNQLFHHSKFLGFPQCKLGVDPLTRYDRSYH